MSSLGQLQAWWVGFPQVVRGSWGIVLVFQDRHNKVTTDRAA